MRDKVKQLMYDSKRNNELADNLENYVDTITSLFILDWMDVDKIKKAKKVVKKAVKNLRNGHPEKVFNEERFEDFIINGREFYEDDDDF